MILFIFPTLLFDFVAFWSSMIIFSQWNKLQTCFKFMLVGAVLVGKSPPTTPDWLWSQLMLSDMFQEHRVLSCENCQQFSQRGGSIINMKGTVRDRSKAIINKGHWILQGNGSWDVMTPSVRKSRFFPGKEKSPYFWRKTEFFFHNWRKKRFLEKDLQICGFLMR